MARCAIPTWCSEARFRARSSASSACISRCGRTSSSPRKLRKSLKSARPRSRATDMDLDVVDTASGKKGSVKLPLQFEEQVRPDLIRKAYQYYASHKRQPWGADPEAGKRSSATVSRRRRQYRGAYGIGISRVPRKILSRRGRRMNWVGAFAPNTVGGRRSHPAKADKIWTKKINKKERRKAIRSAISATVLKDLVAKRGHVVPDNYPFVLDKNFEEL